MEEMIPRPLNVVKTAGSKPKHGIRLASRSSYPFIPCRRSSLRGDSRHSSSDSTNSMATAPDEIPEQIKVPKRSRANTQSSDHGQQKEDETVGYGKGSDKVTCLFFFLFSLVWLTFV